MAHLFDGLDLQQFLDGHGIPPVWCREPSVSLPEGQAVTREFHTLLSRHPADGRDPDLTGFERELSRLGPGLRRDDG
jgi:hypothetical protein